MRPCSPQFHGLSGVATATGSLDVTVNRVTLRAADLPQNSVGSFLISRTQGFAPHPGGSQGVLCLGGSIGRFVGPGQLQDSGTDGTFSLALDLAVQPTPTGLMQIQPGDTWSFQAWFRDTAAGQVTSNFTSRLELTFR